LLSWGPRPPKRKVEYKVPNPIGIPDYAPIVPYRGNQPAQMPVLGKSNRLGASTETKSKKGRAEDRLRIEHELPWVSYNRVSYPKTKPKQKPETKPDTESDPGDFVKPDRFPIDLTTYPNANPKTTTTKTSIKTIPKKTPTKTNTEEEEDSPTRARCEVKIYSNNTYQFYDVCRYLSLYE